jgi:UDP-glucuronate decarboxylase
LHAGKKLAGTFELAELVVGMVGSRSRIVHRPLPENDPKQRQPDISLAQELLGWKPRVALKEGLVSTIAYFEQLLSDNALRSRLPRVATLCNVSTSETTNK